MLIKPRSSVLARHHQPNSTSYVATKTFVQLVIDVGYISLFSLIAHNARISITTQMYCVFQGLSGRTITKDWPGMEDTRRAHVGAPGDPKVQALVVKTEQQSESCQVGEGAELSLPISVKEEDILEVPLKVPRYQYVDFPSLHQCIQQLTVPPLDSWLEGCPHGRPAGRTPVPPKERVPKFKYVDYPSLHHCIKQLSVPPLESWSSGLARPGRGSGDTAGFGSISQSGFVNKSQRGQDCAASAHKPEAYTAFPFPGPKSESIQGVTPFDQATHQPQQPLSLSSPSRARRSRGSYVEQDPQNDIASSHSPPKRPDDSTFCFSGTEKERGTGLSEGSADEPLGELQQKNKSLQIPLPQNRVEHSNSLGQEKQFWRTITESVCPFCQKMFSDSDELRIHQRSHREKRPH